MALPNQVLSQKLTGGAPRRGHRVGRRPPKIANFVPQNTLFLGPKRAKKPVKTDKRREMVSTLHVCLDFLVTNGLLLPSNSQTRPRNGPKMAQNGPKCAQLVSNCPKTKDEPTGGQLQPVLMRPTPQLSFKTWGGGAVGGGGGPAGGRVQPGVGRGVWPGVGGSGRGSGGGLAGGRGVSSQG